MREANALIPFRTPLLLCEALKMQPTPLQRSIFENNERINRFAGKYGEDQELSRALAFCVLWQVLAVKGSKGTILASDESMGRDVMAFLKTVTMHSNASLSDLTNMPSWRMLQFGADVGWNIQLTKNSKTLAEKRGKKTRIALILGERSSEIPFVEASKALSSAMVSKNKRIFWLW